jgi:hypothetical protein
VFTAGQGDVSKLAGTAFKEKPAPVSEAKFAELDKLILEVLKNNS